MIISAGYNIAGPEVEAALLAHPDVAECAVVGAPDEERGQIVAGVSSCSRPASSATTAHQAPAGPRQGDHRAVQVSARGQVRRRAAEDRDRQDPALQIARAGDRHEHHEQRSASRAAARLGARRRATPTASSPTAARCSSPARSAGTRKRRFESDDFVAQVEQALKNIVAVLAGGRRQARAHRAADLVRHRQGRIRRATSARSARPTAA